METLTVARPGLVVVSTFGLTAPTLGVVCASDGFMPLLFSFPETPRTVALGFVGNSSFLAVALVVAVLDRT